MAGRSPPLGFGGGSDGQGRGEFIVKRDVPSAQGRLRHREAGGSARIRAPDWSGLVSDWSGEEGWLFWLILNCSGDKS